MSISQKGVCSFYWLPLLRFLDFHRQTIRVSVGFTYLELTAQQLGLSDETLHDIRQSMKEKDNSHLLVLPVELINSLNYMLKPKHRGPWTQLLKI